MATVDLSNCTTAGTKLRAYLEHFAGEVRAAVRFRVDRYAVPPIPSYDVGFALQPSGQKKTYFETVTSADQFMMEALRGVKRPDAAQVKGVVVRLEVREESEPQTISSQQDQTLPTMWLPPPPTPPTAPPPPPPAKSKGGRGRGETSREGSRAEPPPRAPPRPTAPKEPAVPLPEPQYTPDVMLPTKIPREEKAVLDRVNVALLLLRSKHSKHNLMVALVQRAMDAQEREHVGAQQVRSCAEPSPSPSPSSPLPLPAPAELARAAPARPHRSRTPNPEPHHRPLAGGGCRPSRGEGEL